MDAPSVRKCVTRLLSRREPAHLVPANAWSAELLREIERLDAGQDPSALAVKAGLLLWNDDLEGCHTIAQGLSDEHGAYLHGLMHRREPDYGNSKYWFRRVGELPLFPQLRSAALDLLADAPGLDAYRKSLQSHPGWDAFRMVDWCEAARDEHEVSFLRALQAIEIQGLTYFWIGRAGLPRP